MIIIRYMEELFHEACEDRGSDPSPLLDMIPIARPYNTFGDVHKGTIVSNPLSCIAFTGRFERMLEPAI